MIDHTQLLSKFRSSMSFVQQVNILVYILHHFNQSGLLGDNLLHGICDVECAIDAFRQGADDYLLKPFSISDLLARIRLQPLQKFYRPAAWVQGGQDTAGVSG